MADKIASLGGAARAIRGHLAHNVIAYLALFFAMGGTALATTVIITSPSQVAANTIGSSAIINGAVHNVDLANGSVDATKLVKSEPWHTVGASLQPAFTTYSCGTGLTCEFKSDPAGASPLQFYRDPYGVVHIRGAICWSQRFTAQAPGAGTCSYTDIKALKVVFRLPTGYIPPHNLIFTESSSSDPDANLEVGSGGSVSIYSNVGAVGPTEVDFRVDK